MNRFFDIASCILYVYFLFAQIISEPLQELDRTVTDYQLYSDKRLNQQTQELLLYFVQIFKAYDVYGKLYAEYNRINPVPR
jgi:hypothetical protein